MELFDVAQICVNGHVVNDSTMSFPHKNHETCEVCGAKTITACPSCQEKIPGMLRSSETFGISEYSPPAYCHHCGDLFPWAEKKIKDAIGHFKAIGVINKSQENELFGMIEDIVRGTHKHKLSTMHVHSYVNGLGEKDAQLIHDLLADIVDEKSKACIWNEKAAV